MVGHDMFRQLNCSFKFKNDRKFVNCLKSAAGFFNVGESKAIFRESGISTVVHDKLTILAIVGRSTEKQPVLADASRGSRQQDLFRAYKQIP